MKLQLEFEDPDFEDMIISYFSEKGFKIKNLEELITRFKEAFPEGLKVQAELIEVEVPHTKAAKHDPVLDTLPVNITDMDAVKDSPIDLANSAPILGISDILDPNGDHKPPGRDQLLEETQKEIQYILNQSKNIAKEHQEKAK